MYNIGVEGKGDQKQKEKREMTQAEKNLEAFKRGVRSVVDDEYSSLFSGNVTGDEWANEQDAYEAGVSVAEETIANNAERESDEDEDEQDE